MNDKVLVSIYVPKIEERFEAFLPINKKIHSIIRLLNKSINEMYDGAYPLNTSSVFFCKKDGHIYNINDTIKEASIKNREEIILI